MKKFLSFLIVIILVVVFVTGCNEATVTCESLGDNINAKLDKLTQTVTKLDTIDNQYIASPDIFPTSTSVSYIVPNPQANTPQAPKYEDIKDQRVVRRSIASSLDTNDIIKDLLIEKIQDNLKCDSNGNCYICGNKYGDCDKNSCDSCNNNIICDENGNCTYCNNCLQLDSLGNCQSCQNPCLNTSCDVVNNTSAFNNATKNCANNYKNLLETNEAVADNIALTTDSENFDATNDANLEEDIYVDTNLDESTNNEISPEPKIYYYYEERSFTPENLKYKPRYISESQIENAKTDLNSYVVKIQKLYAMTADVIEANNTLANYKENLLNSIQDTKNVNENYRNIKNNPSMYQVQAIKNYLHDIDTTTKHIRQANGDLNNEINNINKTNNLGITSSVDVMNSNYLRILNHLDTRITYHEIALSTLEQLKLYLLENLNTYEDTNLPSEDTIIEDDNESYVEDNTIIDNEEIIVDSESDSEVNDETQDSEINLEEDNIDNEENTDTSDSFNVIENDDEDNINEENENIINDEQIDENLENTNIDNATETMEDNIDTESTTDNGIVSNIDTYRNNIDSDNVILEEDENINSYATQSDPLNNNEVIANNDIIDENYAYNNNINNNLDANHSNRIINENNLNTDNNRTNGNNYLYDTEGNLYNANTNLNNNGRHNNINTYEYNTLLDSLNQGTIDNGINNL